MTTTIKRPDLHPDAVIYDDRERNGEYIATIGANLIGYTATEAEAIDAIETALDTGMWVGDILMVPA